MIEVVPLHPGQQTPLQLAQRAAEFFGEARSSLDPAPFDVRLPGEPGDLVAEALREAARTKPELIESLPSTPPGG